MMFALCQTCNNRFEQISGPGRKRIYCSPPCRRKPQAVAFWAKYGDAINAEKREANRVALGEYRKIPCQVCGEPLVQAQRLDVKYCSKTCNSKAASVARRESGRLSDYRKRAKQKNPLVFRQQRFDYRARLKNKFIESVVVGNVFADDNYVCQICFEPLDMDAKVPRHSKADCCKTKCFKAPTIDHIIPLSHPDGFHERSNCQSAHFICNSTKAHRLDGETPRA